MHDSGSLIRHDSIPQVQNGIDHNMDKKTIVNDLYQVLVISVLTVSYSMLGKKILKMTPLSIQKFDLEDMGKLAAIVTVSEMT